MVSQVNVENKWAPWKRYLSVFLYEVEDMRIDEPILSTSCTIIWVYDCVLYSHWIENKIFNTTCDTKTPDCTRQCIFIKKFMHVYDPYMGYGEDLATLSSHLQQHTGASLLLHHWCGTPVPVSSQGMLGLTTGPSSLDIHSKIYILSDALRGLLAKGFL